MCMRAGVWVWVQVYAYVSMGGCATETLKSRQCESVSVCMRMGMRATPRIFWYFFQKKNSICPEGRADACVWGCAHTHTHTHARTHTHTRTPWESSALTRKAEEHTGSTCPWENTLYTVREHILESDRTRSRQWRAQDRGAPVPERTHYTVREHILDSEEHILDSERTHSRQWENTFYTVTRKTEEHTGSTCPCSEALDSGFGFKV
jgi:hypothetical protein